MAVAEEVAVVFVRRILRHTMLRPPRLRLRQPPELPGGQPPEPPRQSLVALNPAVPRLVRQEPFLPPRNLQSSHLSELQQPDQPRDQPRRPLGYLNPNPRLPLRLIIET
jgi:hypothetical protein